MSLSIRSVLELVCDDDVGFVEFPVLEMPGVMTVMELMERRSSDLTSRRRLHASWLMMFASAIAGGGEGVMTGGRKGTIRNGTGKEGEGQRMFQDVKTITSRC